MSIWVEGIVIERFRGGNKLGVVEKVVLCGWSKDSKGVVGVRLER